MPIATFLLLPVLLHLLAGLSAKPGAQRPARAAAALALAGALVAAAKAVFAGIAATDWLAAGPLQVTMLVLVNLVGLVVIRYASECLRGDSAEQHAMRWLHLCLAAVNVLVVTNHLLVLWLAWIAISISLHRLLVCYPDRFRAVLAAHKKFLVARVAELAVFAAVMLLWYEHGTFRIDAVLAAYAGAESLSLQSHAAALLLALAALIKCAQLPVHGWLVQVVEAPTPVSALLHAGVINLGGFVMILMAPLVMLSAPARWLLLVVAGLTAVLAALVMMTRISIKVRLAWSTSAQMGLMLVECALGLHALALLHLVGHACYKAGAFLGAGNAVNAWIAARIAGESGTSPAAILSGTALSVAATLSALLLLPGPVTAADVAAWTLVAVAAGALLAGASAGLAGRVAIVTAMVVAYGAQKALAETLLPTAADAGVAAAAWVVLLACALAAGHASLAAGSAGGAWRRWLYAGFYLDEALTRATLRIWPVALPKPTRHAPANTEGDISHARSA